MHDPREMVRKRRRDASHASEKVRSVKEQSVIESTNNLYFSEFENSVINKLDLLVAAVANLQDSMQILMNRQANQNHRVVIKSALFDLPISNVDELIGLESELKLGEKKSKPSDGSLAVFELASVGGERLTEATHRVLTCLMTDELMAKYSFVGRKGKRAFCDLPFLVSSVIRAVRSIISEAKGRDIEDAIKYWLQIAPSRLEKKKKPCSNHAVRNSSPTDS
ncbi:hypothetical protein Fcan01_11877 [Folsomia candida]|uniref:DUF4806 domain-containing protein n=1 Tax=Folsomia candida TaxID=158441 RepID=A0A226E9K2_FOLCA|nr:hypothetical protein Fcan01_11877 [Folsomia candida]